MASTLLASVTALRTLRPALAGLAHNAISRSVLLAQLTARPWSLSGDLVAKELQSFADTPIFDALVDDLAYGPAQKGPACSETGRVTIGWGRHDRLCFPSQAYRAQSEFPAARLIWFEQSGHFPIWEEPDRAVEAILTGVA